MRARIGLLILSATLFLATNVGAQTASLTPARFVDGEYSLQSLIKFPDVEGDVSVAVYCTAGILGSGGIRDTHCFRSKSVVQSFIDPIEAAIKRTHATAAVVDGKRYQVVIYYRVVFVRKDGVPFIGVFPNWGNDVDKYGIEYEAPQRYSKTIYPTNCAEMSGDFEVFATMLVGADGVVSGDATFDRSAKNIKDAHCAKSIETLHKSAKYIPGQLEGKPVETAYLEAWGDFEAMEVK